MVELRFSCDDVKVYKGKFDVNSTIFDSFAIDPNVGRKEIYTKTKTLLITHGHADHFGDALILSNVKIFAPRHETPLIENPEINWRGMFSWAKLPEEVVTPYFLGRGVKVSGFSDEIYSEKNESCIKAIPMPGHTPSHTAYLVNNVLVASDAIHCPKYWEKFKILYYVDPDKMAESLMKVKSMDWDYIVPGHGDVFDRDDGIKAIKFNLKMLEKIDKEIFDEIGEDGTRECDIMSIFAERYGFKGVKAILVIMPPIRGHITSMCERGIVKLFEKDGYIYLKKIDKYKKFKT